MKIHKRTLSIIINTFFLVLFSLFFAACTQDQPKLPHLVTGNTIVAFGDSLTYGVGTSQENSYPAVLEKLIGFRVINAGVSGETTEGSISRLPGVLEKYKPALVILCIGGNDMLHRIPHETIANNLKQLIEMVKSSGASVVLIGVPQLSIMLSSPDFYKEIAHESDIPVDMTLLPKLLRTQEYKSDAIHLNAEGYHAFAEGIAAFLKKQGAID